MEAVVVLSGGLDSTVLAYDFVGCLGADQVIALTADYGQRHRKEIEYARRTAERLGIVHEVADLRGIAHLLGGSALTDDIPVPHGHYAADNMKATVVPNRNAILLSVAVGLAVARGARTVAVGVHAGDHPIYPDCRPKFIEAFQEASRLATEGYGAPDLAISAPFVDLRKQDIVLIGRGAGARFQDTWSCYEGGEFHCGKCGTCVERQEAFLLAGVKDPTVYVSQ